MIDAVVVVRVFEFEDVGIAAGNSDRESLAVVDEVHQTGLGDTRTDGRQAGAADMDSALAHHGRD